MGGFGAYYSGFRHPDVYGCVLAMSPGALADGELAIAMDTWRGDNNFLTGYARAFSPLMEDENKKFGKVPEMTNTEEDLAIQKDLL